MPDCLFCVTRFAKCRCERRCACTGAGASQSDNCYSLHVINYAVFTPEISLRLSVHSVCVNKNCMIS